MILHELSIGFKELFDIQYGTVKTWLLMTSVELKVFNLTKENVCAEVVAEKLELHKGNTELFLNALCSLNLLTKKKNCYKNTDLSETFLTEDKETYLGDYLIMNDEWILQSKKQMKELLKNGPMVNQDSADFSDNCFARHIKAMRNFSRSGPSQVVSDIISHLPEFAKMRKMLDIGGAHGIDCIAVVLRNPELRGVVFDKPPIIKTTREIISEYGLEGRIDVMGGDYTLDPVGTDYDLVYARATFNFIKNNLNPVFKKIYDSLNTGGIFISLHDGLTDENTAPPDMVISWLSSSLSTFDFSFPHDYIADAMLDTGFKNVHTKTIDFPFFGPMDLIIARK